MYKGMLIKLIQKQGEVSR